MNYLGYIGTILVCIIGYLIGSFNWAIILGKKIKQKDVRNYYSKNAGATNTYRTFGYKWGFSIFIFRNVKSSINNVNRFFN